MKVAIIGSGIAGNTAAWYLNNQFDLTIFEKNDYIGGHSNTVSIDYDGQKIDVDTGFIVFNDRTYPNLINIFDQLGVEKYPSDMSFGISCKRDGFEFCVKNLRGLFAQKSNLINPKFYRMLFDIVKFNARATKFVLHNQDYQHFDLTLGDFLQKVGVGRYFLDYFLLPMAGAIWSCPANEMLKYPALSFLRFYHNHGLLTLFSQPKWYTVKGCSKAYVKKMTAKFADKIKLNCAVREVEKKGTKIQITDQNGEKYLFDRVIFANHANQILQMHQNPDPEMKRVLSKFKFKQNLAVLHRDESLMPKSKAAWASWIYLREEGGDDSRCNVTYYMNELQDIDKKYPLFVTLNPQKEIAKDKIFASFEYQHPTFDTESIKAQEQIQELQGLNGFYYAGAYLANGFHEDGVNSAIKVAKLFDAKTI